MNDVRTDSQLVAAHLAGDRGALAGIYDRYSAALYDTAAAMLNDRHEAGDVMQDVFVMAAQKLGQLREPERLKPWLFAILRNEVYRRTKRRSRTRPTDFSGPGAAEMAAPIDPAAEASSVAYAELAELVRSAAAGLDERDQLVLELSVRQGLAGADLADALGVTAEQSYVLVHRMRERVERSLGALTVARMGRKECTELATVLTGWDGRFSVLIRKRVARHVDACQTCERTRRKYALIPLLGAAPAYAAPPELRETVLTKAYDAVAAPNHGYGFTREGGFPNPLRHGRKLLAIAAATVVGIGALGGVALSVVDDDPSPIVAVENIESTTLPGSAVTDAVIVTEPTTADSTAADTGTTATPTTAPLDTVAGKDDVIPAQTTDPGTLPPTTLPPTTAAPATTPTTAPKTSTSVSSNPPATSAPTTAPPTTAAPTTAPPTTPPPAPGNLALSSPSIDLGASANSASLTLSNTGGTAVSWTLGGTGSGSPLGWSSGGGTIEPGQSASLQFTILRDSLPEGTITRSFSISSSASGGGSVTVTARVEHAPTITAVRGLPSPSYCPSPTNSPKVTAATSDESGIGSATLSWVKSDGTGGGSASMSGSGNAWSGTLGITDRSSGVWAVTVTVVDTRGNSASTTAGVVVAC